jgi:hypothetical protein
MSIPAGWRAAYVEGWLRSVAAVLVVIGPGWVDAIDPRGRRRLRGRTTRCAR